MTNIEIKITDNGKTSTKQYNDFGKVSDGYHTFDELYYYRMLYNAGMVDAIQKLLDDGVLSSLDWKITKSHKHSDGKECFDGGWFVVMIETPEGQVSNHYENKYWDMFKCEEVEKAPVWDGHSPEVAAARLKKLIETYL